MVNNIIKSRFKDVEEAQLATLTTDSPKRELPNKIPLYPREELLALIETLQSEDDEDMFFNFATIDSRDDWYDLLDLHEGVILTTSGLTVELRLRHVFEAALNSASHFYKSELCITSKPQRWLACDVYVFNLQYWRADLMKEYPIQVYLKFALSDTGSAVFMCSLHD